MTVQTEELSKLIQANPDPRELKRALAVQMLIQNYKYSTIGSILRVSVSFISKWKYIFVEQGVAGMSFDNSSVCTVMYPITTFNLNYINSYGFL